MARWPRARLPRASVELGAASRQMQQQLPGHCRCTPMPARASDGTDRDTRPRLGDCSVMGSRSGRRGRGAAAGDGRSAGRLAGPREQLAPSVSARCAPEAGRAKLVWCLQERPVAAADATFVPSQAGNTALIAAADRGQTDVVRLLLHQGANIEAKNAVGLTDCIAGSAGRGRTAIRRGAHPAGREARVLEPAPLTRARSGRMFAGSCRKAGRRSWRLHASSRLRYCGCCSSTGRTWRPRTTWAQAR